MGEAMESPERKAVGYSAFSNPVDTELMRLVGIILPGKGALLLNGSFNAVVIEEKFPLWKLSGGTVELV